MQATRRKSLGTERQLALEGLVRLPPLANSMVPTNWCHFIPNQSLTGRGMSLASFPTVYSPGPISGMQYRCPPGVQGNADPPPQISTNHLTDSSIRFASSFRMLTKINAADKDRSCGKSKIPFRVDVSARLTHLDPSTGISGQVTIHILHQFSYSSSPSITSPRAFVWEALALFPNTTLTCVEAHQSSCSRDSSGRARHQLATWR